MSPSIHSHRLLLILGQIWNNVALSHHNQTNSERPPGYIFILCVRVKTMLCYRRVMAVSKPVTRLCLCQVWRWLMWSSLRRFCYFVNNPKSHKDPTSYLSLSAFSDFWLLSKACFTFFKSRLRLLFSSLSLSASCLCCRQLLHVSAGMDTAWASCIQDCDISDDVLLTEKEPLSTSTWSYSI